MNNIYILKVLTPVANIVLSVMCSQAQIQCKYKCIYYKFFHILLLGYPKHSGRNVKYRRGVAVFKRNS